MSIKDTFTQLALALFVGIHLTINNTAVAVTTSRQYSSHQAKSYYPQSLPSYGGSESQNDFSNRGEQRYSSEAKPHQQFPFPLTSYGNRGAGYDDIDDQYSRQQYSQQHDSFQPHTSYHDHLDGTYRQEQDSFFDSYGRHYDSRQSDDGRETSTSTLLSYDNIDFNNSEMSNYQKAEDVLYPPLDNQQSHQYQESTKQQNLQIADYMTANENMPTTSRVNPLQSISHQTGEKSSHDNEASANAAAQILVTMSRPPTQPRTAHDNVFHQLNGKSYIDIENQQDQHHLSRTNERQPQQHASHLEAHFTNNSDVLFSSSSPPRTYYVAADSDLSFSNSNHAASSNPVSLLHSHLAKLPALSSPQAHLLPAHAPQQSFGIISEPIPISKHVEITKHVPVPVYRQVHVPFRKPVRIEIPRPVISTVRRPYPIQIPITKTVAVPLVKEVKIPIEKVTPYPVEHRVPYVVEKRVPFQVERQIAAPIYYPFPVRVPMVRTILHKKKSHLSPLHYHPRIHI